MTAGDASGPAPGRTSRPERYLLGIGWATLDHVVQVEGFPPPDSKVETSAALEDGGGPVATALVTAARLNVPTRLVAALGDDARGRRIRADLSAEQVDTTGLILRSGCASPWSFVVVEPSAARRTIFWSRGDAAPLAPSEIPAGLVEGAAALLVDGHQPAAQLDACRRARAAGVPVVLDAGSLREATRALLPLAGHAVVSEAFACAWCGATDPGPMLAELRDAGPAVAVITLGARGCLASDGGRMIRLAAMPVERPDTTGAGDVFHGAYAAGLILGMGLRDRLRLATAAAGLKCRAPGARAGIPGLEEALAAAGMTGASAPPPRA